MDQSPGPRTGGSQSSAELLPDSAAAGCRASRVFINVRIRLNSFSMARSLVIAAIGAKGRLAGERKIGRAWTAKLRRNFGL
jgi:hypothetical protein